MRVAHLTPVYFASESMVGGGERYVYNIVQSLSAAGGIDQCVFALGPEARSFDHAGIPVRVLPNESKWPDPMDSYSGALSEALNGFDLVHIHQCVTLFGAYATAVACSVGVPAIGTDLGGGENELMLRGRGIQLLSGIVSISRFAHDLVARYFAGPHQVLIGPVDTQRFCPDASVARDPRLVLCVGRIMPHKGIDRLIAALPPELRLIVVGRVYHQAYYELLCCMAAGRNVEFFVTADDDQLIALYRSAGLLVQAATSKDVYGNFGRKSELMGLATLEAMACGLPVAVADTGALPELVPDARFGRIFGSDDELRAVLQSAASGTWPPAEAPGAAREHVVRHHDVQPIGEALVRFYSAVLAGGRRGMA